MRQPYLDKGVHFTHHVKYHDMYSSIGHTYGLAILVQDLFPHKRGALQGGHAPSFLLVHAGTAESICFSPPGRWLTRRSYSPTLGVPVLPGRRRRWVQKTAMH